MQRERRGSTSKWLFFIILLSAVLSPRGGYAQPKPAGPSQSGKFVASRVLVKFRSGVTESQIHGVLGAHMGWSQKVLEGIGVHLVSLASGVNEEATVQAL